MTAGVLGLSNGKAFEDLFRLEESKYLSERDGMVIHPRQYTDQKDINPDYDQFINKYDSPFQYSEPQDPITPVANVVPMVAKPQFATVTNQERLEGSFNAVQQSETDTIRRIQYVGESDIPKNAMFPMGSVDQFGWAGKAGDVMEGIGRFVKWNYDSASNITKGIAAIPTAKKEDWEKLGRVLFGENRHETIPEKAVKEIGASIKRMATQQYDWEPGKPTSPQMIEDAFNVAGLMVGGPSLIAGKVADGTLGSFAGVKAKGYLRKDLDQAIAMWSNGKNADLIWEKTGFFRDLDGQWKFEISPEKTRLNYEFDEMLKEGTTLGEVFNHPKLYKAYPEFKDIKVSSTMPDPTGMEGLNPRGVWFDDYNTIYLKPGLTAEEARSVVLHEIQHVIQKKEGFAEGGNANMFKSQAVADAEQLWEKTAMNEFMKLRDAGYDPDLVFNASNAANKLYRGKRLTPEESDAAAWARDMGLAEKFDNIAHGGYLLDKAQMQRDLDYLSLMGEVEARNIQTRMDYSDYTRRAVPPWRSMDVVPQDQVYFKSSLKPQNSASVSDFRRGANDNKPQQIESDFEEILATQLQNIFPNSKSTMSPKDYIAASNKMNEYGTWLFSGTDNMNDISLARYNKMRKDLAEASGDEYIPIKSDFKSLNDDPKVKKAKEKADKAYKDFMTDLNKMQKKYPTEDFTPMVVRKLKEWFKEGFPPPKLPLGPR